MKLETSLKKWKKKGWTYLSRHVVRIDWGMAYCSACSYKMKGKSWSRGKKAVKRDGQKNKKRFNLVPNSVALGVAVFGARASLYSQQPGIDLLSRYAHIRARILRSSRPSVNMNAIIQTPLRLQLQSSCIRRNVPTIEYSWLKLITIQRLHTNKRRYAPMFLRF